MTSPASDSVRRFIFEHQPVRGQWVRLDAAWRELRAHQEYPAPVRDLLGEAVTAAVLLAATLKFQGTLTLQLQGDGLVKLLVAQCTNDFRVRAVARFDGGDLGKLGAGPEQFRALVGEGGRLTVTIEASERDARYQGIVPLGGASLEESLETYFASSEQIPTRVRLTADDARAAGLLVQKLPTDERKSEVEGRQLDAAWQAAQAGAARIELESLLRAPVEPVLEQAFAGHDVRLYGGTPVQFECSCNPERVSDVLRSLGAAELRDILREQGGVAVTCEFCQRPYRFEAPDLENLIAEAQGGDKPATLH